MAYTKKNNTANAPKPAEVNVKRWSDITGEMKIRGTVWDAGTDKEHLSLSVSLNRKDPETGKWNGVDIPVIPINDKARDDIQETLNFTDEVHCNTIGDVTGWIGVSVYKDKAALRVCIDSFRVKV